MATRQEHKKLIIGISIDLAQEWTATNVLPNHLPILIFKIKKKKKIILVLVAFGLKKTKNATLFHSCHMIVQE